MSKVDILARLNNISNSLVCATLILSGGEPLMQVDQEFVNFFKSYGYKIHIETNGHFRVPIGVDWVTMSPKGNPVLKRCNELKVVFDPYLGGDTSLRLWVCLISTCPGRSEQVSLGRRGNYMGGESPLARPKNEPAAWHREVLGALQSGVIR